VSFLKDFDRERNGRRGWGRVVFTHFHHQ